MKTQNPISVTLAVAGICLATVSAMAQANYGQAVFSNISISPLGTSTLGPMNGAYIGMHVFNDAPSSVGTYNNTYPSTIQFNESNVANPTMHGLERDVWYFSNNGGSSPYTFQAGDYFTASFSMTLSGGIAGHDLEGGFLFSNPSGAFGGDDQIFVVGQGGNAGTIFQGGGPSYYPFSPGAGGYPGVGAKVPNYTNGTTINLTYVYTFDPNTQTNAFEYAVNGQYAESAAGDPYFDLHGPVGNPGDYLGAYFQVAPTPEPSTLALLGLGVPPLVRRLRRRA